MERIAAFLVDRSKVVIALTVLTTLAAGTLALARMSFNADITAFLAESSEAGRTFAALQEKYKSQDPITVLLERKDGGVMTDRTGLELILAAKQAFTKVEGVKAVGCVLPEKNPYTGEAFDKVALDNLPEQLFPLLTESAMASMLFSPDKKSTMAVVSVGDSPIETALRVEKTPLPDGLAATYAGNPIVFASVIDTLNWFLLFLPPCVVILLLLVFAVNIGSRKLAVIAITPALMGSVWTFGMVFGLGFRVDIVTVIVPIWVIVMGSADGLHFITHLQEAAAHTDDRKAQTVSALREVGIPMILTTVSTSAGFLSFLFTDVAPMRQLGVFAACGIAFAGIVSFFFLPALLSRQHIEPPHEHAVGGRLVSWLEHLARRRVAAAVLVVVCAGFSAVYIPRLAVNPDQMFFFKNDHPVRAAFSKMSEVFGGATPLFGEFVFDPAGDRDAQLARFREVERGLEQLHSVRRVFSLADVAEAAPPELVDQMFKGEVSSPLGRMVSDDGLRFVVFPTAFTADDLLAWRTWAGEHKEIRVLTGTPVLFDEMSRLVFRAQATSLLSAFALVGLMLLLAYRRFSLTLIALVPMAVTVAVLLGFLAASGIQLNLLTAVISSIAIGVGIDYAIHLLAAIEYSRDGTPGYALRGLHSSGRAILANALGVSVGLSALFLSPLKPHGQIAMVMWVSMILGAFSTLVIIPALLPKDATTAPPVGGTPG